MRSADGSVRRLRRRRATAAALGLLRHDEGLRRRRRDDDHRRIGRDMNWAWAGERAAKPSARPAQREAARIHLNRSSSPSSIRPRRCSARTPSIIRPRWLVDSRRWPQARFTSGAPADRRRSTARRTHWRRREQRRDVSATGRKFRSRMRRRGAAGRSQRPCPPEAASLTVVAFDGSRGFATTGRRMRGSRRQFSRRRRRSRPARPRRRGSADEEGARLPPVPVAAALALADSSSPATAGRSSLAGSAGFGTLPTLPYYAPFGKVLEHLEGGLHGLGRGAQRHVHRRPRRDLVAGSAEREPSRSRASRPARSARTSP